MDGRIFSSIATADCTLDRHYEAWRFKFLVYCLFLSSDSCVSTTVRTIFNCSISHEHRQ